jgi:ABC-2 type transport system ATP-binding protein
MPASVIVHDLHKRYGRREAVKGVSFTVEPGEIVGLLGPNGAGKTTTLECLVGLRDPDRGEITIAGFDGRQHRREVREKMGVVLQDTALPDRITAREALRLFGSFYRERTNPATLLERFALTDCADAHYLTLSGGQKQRLALALAFVNRPEIVVLDEPTAGLDPQSRHELHAGIRRLKQEGCAVLLSTHYLEEAEQLCDRIAIIDHGQIVAAGGSAELIAQSTSLQTVTLVTTRELDASALAQVDGVRELRCEGFTANFRTTDAAGLLTALGTWLAARHIEVRELHVKKASLEELFLRLTHAGDELEKDSP